MDVSHVGIVQDENLMATETESVEKIGWLEVAGKDDGKYQVRNYGWCRQNCG